MSKRGEKMRTEVLAVLRDACSALSAYDVSGELHSAHPNIAPPNVYNALAALTKDGWVHRIESLKAYVACQCGEPHPAPVLSICDDCGSVEERVAPDLLTDLSGFVEETGLAQQRHIVEVHGICFACNSGAGQP